MLKLTAVLIVAAAVTSAGCTSARFASPPPDGGDRYDSVQRWNQSRSAAPQMRGPVAGAPFTREKEDREFGQ
jgi:hypothetical protein